MTSLSENTVVTTSGGLVELGYAERTSAYEHSLASVSTAADVFASDLTFIADGSTVIVEFYSPSIRVLDSAHGAYVHLVNAAGTSLGIMGRFFDQLSPDGESPCYCQYRYTPPAGATTINIRGVSSAAGSRINLAGGGAGAETNTPMYLRVSKVVQASQFIVPLASVPSVTSLPTSPINGQEVNLYSQYGYTRQLWDGAQWNIVSDNRKVYFHANTSTILGTTAGTTMAFNRTTVNQGNCFNTSTYLFTAPFAGDYKFRVQAQKRNAGVMQMYWLINGSTTNNRGVYTDIGSDSVGPNMEIILNLAANTTVGVYYTLSAGDVYGGSTEYFTYFQGEYLA